MSGSYEPKAWSTWPVKGGYHPIITTISWNGGSKRLLTTLVTCICLLSMSLAPLLGPALISGTTTNLPSEIEGSRSTTLIVANPEVNFTSLDPAVLYDSTGLVINQNIYENLVYYDGESASSLLPVLCTEVPSAANGLITDGGYTYTYHLREGVRFHDGSALTSEDVFYSFARVLRLNAYQGPAWMMGEFLIPDYYSYGPAEFDVDGSLLSYTGVPANIIQEHIWMKDETTIQLNLTNPFSGWNFVISSLPGAIVSKDFVEAHGGMTQAGFDYMWDHTCGTGPFEFSEFVSGDHILLVRNDQYWQATAALEQVLIQKVADANQRALMLKAGDADIISLSSFMRASVEGDANITIREGEPTFDMNFLGMNQDIITNSTLSPNTDVPSDFFADKNVRKAFAYAFDYAQYVSGTSAIQPNGAIPMGMFGYDPNVPYYETNLDLVRSYLENATFIEGMTEMNYLDQGFSLDLFYNTGNDGRRYILELLEQTLEEANPGMISITINEVAWSTYLTAYSERSIPIFILGWAPDFSDPHNYMSPFYFSSGMYSPLLGYSNQTVDDMITAAALEQDSSVREYLYSELNMLMYDECVYIWASQRMNFQPIRSWVSGYFYNPMFGSVYFYPLSIGTSLSEPVDLSAVPEGSQMVLNWQPPYNDGGAPISNYMIYRGNGTSEPSLLATVGDVLTYNDTTVEPMRTYYYRVSAVNFFGEGPQSWEVWATTGDEYEPDDGPELAKAIPTDGTLQYRNFNAMGDVDWINFTALSGDIYTVEAFGENIAEPILAIYDTDGATLLARNGEYGWENPSRLFWTAERTDNYYVAVQDYFGWGGESMGYSINIISSSPTAPDAYEPDDTYVQANPIATDGSIQPHNFNLPGDTDWMKFSVTSGKIYIISTMNSGDRCHPSVTLYDSALSTVLMGATDGGQGSWMRWDSIGLPSGYYYLKVIEPDLAFGEGCNYEINVTVDDVGERTYDAAVNPNDLNALPGSVNLFGISVRNLATSMDTYTISIDGIDPAWCSLSQAQLVASPGEYVSATLTVTVPETATLQTIHITVSVASSLFGTEEDINATMDIVGDPTIINLLPYNGTRATSTEVWFSWLTDLESTTEVFIKRSNESVYQYHTGASSTLHALSVSIPDRDCWYDFYVRSSTDFGSSDSEARSFFLTNGVIFSERVYTFLVPRDYNHVVNVSVTNVDTIPHRLLVNVTHPYDDIVAGFIGQGSDDKVFSLAAGESMDLQLAIHAPDAMGTNYNLTLHLSSFDTNGTNETSYDDAIAQVTVDRLDANFTMTEVGIDPATLTKTMRIQNFGDRITDLTISLNDELKGLVRTEPLIQNAVLGLGEIIEFEIIPHLSLDFQDLNGTISAKGYTMVVNVSVNFTIPDGYSVFLGDADAGTNVTEHQESCLNKRDWIENIPTPPKIDLRPDWFKKWVKRFDRPRVYHVCTVRGSEIREDVAVNLENLENNNFDHPSYIWDNGVSHSVWHSDESGQTDVFYMRWSESGGTEVRTDLSNSPGSSQWPSVCDFGDDLYVFWVENSSGVIGIGFTRSLDGGNTWDPMTVLTGPTGNIDDPIAVVDSSGRIHLVWEDFRWGDSEIYYMSSEDAGTTWSTDQRLTDTSGDSRYASIIIDREDRLHVVWTDERNGVGQIYYMNSPDLGTTWSGSIAISPATSDAGEASITTSDDGAVHIVWRDSRFSQSEIFYRNSTDNGTSWGSEIRLTDDQSYSEYPIVLPAKDGSVGVVWHDNRTGGDLLYTKMSMPYGETARLPRYEANLLEVYLVMDFVCPTSEVNYDRFNIYATINGHLVASMLNVVPNGSYIFPVDPEFLNYGSDTGAVNEIHMWTDLSSSGHYMISADKTLVFHMSYMDVPVIAQTQDQADQMVKELDLVTWRGVDPAVYANEIVPSNDTVMEGETVNISAIIRNMGEDAVNDVSVAFFDGDPTSGGVQIGTDIIIPSIEKYGVRELNVTWVSLAGAHRIFVVVDGADLISELDESNNKEHICITVHSHSPPSGVLLINDGDPIAIKREVVLDITAFGENKVVQFAFSNDDISWWAWEPYVTTRNWALTPGDGPKTVYCRVMDAAGHITVFNDTIVLDTTSQYDVPSPPLDLLAVAGDSKVDLTWSMPENDGGLQITSFKVYRGASSGTETLLITLGSILNHTDASVVNGQTYYYRVTAVNAIGEGPMSNEVSAVPLGTPTAPTITSAVAGNEKVNLTWDPPIDDGGSAITGYKVHARAESGGTLLLNLGNVTSCTFNALINGMTYYFQVSAVNGEGEGALSNEVSATPATVPTAPINLEATAGVAKVILNWDMSLDNGGSAITHYVVYRGDSSGTGTPVATLGQVLSYIDMNVTVGQTYFYVITAINAMGEGPGSNEVSITVVSTPSAPTLVSATAGNAQVTLTWSAPSDDGGLPVTGYKVYRGTSSETETLFITLGDVLTYTNSGLNNGQTYYYKVSAINVMGEGPLSNELSAKPVTIPSAPMGLSALGNNGQVSLSWSTPYSNGGTTITGYKIYRGTTSGAETLLTTVGNVLTYADNAVTNGQKYYYKVSAVNSVGEGPMSNEASATPATLPSAPLDLTAAVGNAQVTLDWSAPSNNGGAEITGYRIYRGTSSGTETLLISIGNVLTYTDSTVTNGETYFYKVKAVNSKGDSTFSNEASATPMTVPSAPLSLIAVSGDTQIVLSWSAPSSDGGSTLTGYMLYRGTVSGGEVLLATVGDVLTYTDTAVTIGQTYYYKVSALNIVGEGAFSNEVSAALITDEIDPTVVIISPGNNTYNNTGTVTVTWQATDNEGGSGICECLYSMDGTAWTTASGDCCTLSSLSDGRYTVYVKAVDNAGNSGVTSVTFTVDMTAPSILSRSPTGNGHFMREKIVVTFSEVMNTSSVSITVSDVIGTVVWSGNTATFTPWPTLRGHKDYTVTVTGEDLAGNAMSDSWTFSTAKVGKVSGKVLDEEGEPVANAVVKLRNVTQGYPMRMTGLVLLLDNDEVMTVTDANGTYEFYDVFIGNYTLIIEREGFDPATVPVSMTLDDVLLGGTPVEDVELPEEGEDGFPLVPVIVAVLVIVIVGILLIVMRRKKPPVQAGEQRTKTEARKEGKK